MPHQHARLIAQCVLPILVFFICATPLSAQNKLAIPSEPDQQQSLELIREIYGEELGSAKTSSKKQALAKKLLGKAKEAIDPTNRYVLLREARDLAAQAGDVDLAFFAIDEMDSRYQVDAYKLKGLALSQAAKSAKGQKHLGSIAEHALPLIDQAVEKDDFGAAKDLGKLALDSARKARAREVLKQVVTRNGEVAEIAKAYEATRDAFAKLKKEPVDPEANLAVGKYLCFLKGHWDKGLPMLALGTDEGLKKLAVKELEGASDVDGQVALGDGWWDLTSTSEGVAKKQLKGRASYWYRKALPGVTGLVKDKVGGRLEEHQRVSGKTVREHYLSPRMIENVQFLDYRNRTWKNDIRHLFEIRKLKNGYRVACSIRDGYKQKLVLFPKIDVAGNKLVASFTVLSGYCQVTFRPLDLSPKGAGPTMLFQPGQDYHVELWFENGVGKCRVNGDPVAVLQTRDCYGFFAFMPSQHVSMVFHELYFVKREK